MRQQKASKRAHGQLRASQLITTFGPGAMMDLPNYAVLIGGLDSWFPLGEQIVEPRLAQKLSNLLQVTSIELRQPPIDMESYDKMSGIVAYQFPEWFITQEVRTDPQYPHIRSRMLVHRKALTNGKYIDEDRKKHSVVPVRFVRACQFGHIGDIDWPAFVHGGNTSCTRQLWMDEHGTSSDISEVYIRCECGQKESMAKAVDTKLHALGNCDGSRLWLGPMMKEKCGKPNRLLIRTASNAYFPQIMSVISLPERDERVKEAIDSIWDFLSEVEDVETLQYERKKAKVNAALDGISDEEVMKELRFRRDQPKEQTKSVKEAELETLISTTDEIGEDRLDGFFYARSLPVKEWQETWMNPIIKVVLVHRLREVMALFGFTRFEPHAPNVQGEYDMDVRRADIARETNWLPAIENKGEGIFLQFDPSKIIDWIAKNEVQERGIELSSAFELWRQDHQGTRREFLGLPYVMLHTFSHLLLTAISLECGYPASSIRERIYASSRGYGILLYTGSADAEGTLGGLIEAGKKIREHVYSALQMGELCSNDPICSQHNPSSSHERRFLHGSACHGCVLIAETSCEQHNDFLDRSLVVPTLNNRNIHFFPWPIL